MGGNDADSNRAWGSDSDWIQKKQPRQEFPGKTEPGGGSPPKHSCHSDYQEMIR